MYYRGAQAAIVVYDLTSPETFARAKSWVKELQRQASPNIVIALVGNKCDQDNKRAVASEVRRFPVIVLPVCVRWRIVLIAMPRPGGANVRGREQPLVPRNVCKDGPAGHGDFP